MNRVHVRFLSTRCTFHLYSLSTSAIHSGLASLHLCLYVRGQSNVGAADINWHSVELHASSGNGEHLGLFLI